jgi:alkyldihydroxyacetonephosphate synthase
MQASAENGERGYLLTYKITYIRDFGNEHYIVAESFETSISWSRVLELCDRVKQRVKEEHALRRPPGTHSSLAGSHTGAAVYFYFAYLCKGVENPPEVYAEIEKAARDEILLCGGALSHHQRENCERSSCHGLCRVNPWNGRRKLRTLLIRIIFSIAVIWPLNS